MNVLSDEPKDLPPLNHSRPRLVRVREMAHLRSRKLIRPDVRVGWWSQPVDARDGVYASPWSRRFPAGRRWLPTRCGARPTSSSIWWSWSPGSGAIPPSVQPRARGSKTYPG